MKNLKKILTTAVIIGAVMLLFFLVLSVKKAEPFKRLKFNREFNSLSKKAAEAEKAGDKEEAIIYLEKIAQDLPKYKKIDEVLFNLARLYEENNQLLQAKNTLQKIIAESENGKLIQEAQAEIGDLNIKILFSPLITDNSFVYEVKEGDSLTKLAKQFNTAADLLIKANRIKGDTLRLGMKLKVTKAKFTVFVDKSQNTLALKSNGEILKVYTVSTGLDNVTPVGTFKITNKLVNPTWYKDGVAIPAGNPQNILGTRWMGLSEAGYGIHGTTQPETIGKHITQGCVRMYNEEVDELYTILPVGTEVVIVE